MKPYLYLRALRHADHTVFCVANGQKTYGDLSTGRYQELPFSSGQQVKRSILTHLVETLGITEAPITFNFAVKKEKDKLSVKNAEPHSPCDPTYPDQLLGGWMRAIKGGGESTIKRRSPLSISAMRPLHPLLASTSTESVTFDRSQNVSNHIVQIRDDSGKEITLEEALTQLGENMRDLTPRTWIGDALKTATGLFIYDVAIDLRRLFSVSLQQLEPEINTAMVEKLRQAGWIESKNAFGPCLVCPKTKRTEYINGLAEALLEWRITSNQARTFSPMETLAIALSDNANAIAGAIRADLRDDTARPAAIPRLDRNAGADLFIALPAGGYIHGEVGSSSALINARQWLIDKMTAYDYENQ